MGCFAGERITADERPQPPLAAPELRRIGVGVAQGVRRGGRIQSSRPGRMPCLSSSIIGSSWRRNMTMKSALSARCRTRSGSTPASARRWMRFCNRPRDQPLGRGEGELDDPVIAERVPELEAEAGREALLDSEGHRIERPIEHLELHRLSPAADARGGRAGAPPLELPPQRRRHAENPAPIVRPSNRAQEVLDRVRQQGHEAEPEQHPRRRPEAELRAIGGERRADLAEVAREKISV